MRPPPPQTDRPGAEGSEPPPEPLFNAAALEAAARHGGQSHSRWLALSDDPEAVALRAALQPCFALAGRRGDALRRGLMHERWGQHAGALGHLLALGLLAQQGWSVEVEPELDGQAPDILATRDAAAGGEPARLLVEVRAISGAGNFPWEQRRADRRSLAQDREQLERLTASVAKVIAHKADVYRPLAARLALPYVICVYEDKDEEISALVRDIAFGRSAAGHGTGGRGAGDDARDPDGGAFAQDAARFGAVSAVIVFGRLDNDAGSLLLRGDLIVNPRAAVPLPEAARFPLLRTYGLDDAAQPPRMRWLQAAREFPLGPA